VLPGFDWLREDCNLTRTFPMVRIVLLSRSADEGNLYASLRAGAAGYLPNDATRPELRLAIRAVAKGETYLHPPVLKPKVMKRSRRKKIGLPAL